MARRKKKKKKEENKPSKLKELSVKFKFDDHHKMERFVVISIVFMLMFAGVSTGSLLKYRSLVTSVNTAQAIYTPSSKTSLTETEIRVYGVYRNSKWRGYI